MTDQTTPEPLTDEETLPLSSSDQARRLLAEIDRLRAHRDQLRAETLRLGISLAEAIHERRQLRTDLAGAERYRTAALAVAADLTDDLAEARAEIERRDVRWDELVEEKNRLIEDSESLRAQLDAADRLRCCVCDTSLGYTNYIRQQFCGPCANGETPAQEPATATPAPDPDPSEGPAPTSRPRPAQGTAPLTLAQAASALHDWAGDLDDGANTAWPAGHADVIRGIRSAADWLDARSAYETEVRQRATEPEETPTLADAIAAAAIGGRRAANALAEAMATPSGHEPEEAHEEPPCIPVTVHTYGLTDTARNGLIDRVATAAHALDEDVSCTVGGTCPQCEPPEEAPEPTWRDVIRAMRAEGIHLRPLYDIADWPVDRTWQLIDHHGSELGIVTHETSYAGEEWTLALSYERGPSTRIGAEALQPADVLAAARIAGLIGDTDA